MRKRKKPESALATRVAHHMMIKYPKIPYRFDIGADVSLPIGIARRLHALHGIFRKGHPDMMVMSCRGGYGGLYLELKATDTVVDSEHTRTQAKYHSVLRRQGYKVKFVCGYDESVKAIKKYMKLKKNKV